MKKLVSVLCVLALLAGMAAFSAVSTSAVEAAQTVVDVKPGDVVTYSLTLGGVELPVIGCDFSFYYDSSVFDVETVSDFTGSTDPDDWEAFINTELDGEVRGNWSILRGVDFSTDRNFITLTLKAKSSASGHISYFVRYMYDDHIFDDDSRPQIEEYQFTCTVLLNGEPVLEKAQPELNTVETQDTGLFVNSVTGDSKDADPEVPGVIGDKTAYDNGGKTAYQLENEKNNNSNNNNGNNNNNSGNSGNSGNNTAVTEAEKSAPAATTAEGYYVTATDAAGNVTATSDEAPAVTTTGTDDKGGSSPVIWIIIVLVVLAGGGAAAYFYMKKKPSADVSKPE